MTILPLACGRSSKLNCFTLTLLLTRLRGRVLRRGLAATKESVNDRPGVEQLANSCESCRLGDCSLGHWAVARRSQIGPCRRYQNAAAVGQHQK